MTLLSSAFHFQLKVGPIYLPANEFHFFKILLIIEKRHNGKGRWNYTITNSIWASCMEKAREVFKRRKNLEDEIFEQRRNRTDKTPSSYHQQVTTLNPEMRRIR